MSGGIGSINSVTSGTTPPAPPVPAVSTGAQNAAAAPVTFFHNPRIIQDPSAGYITQYLSANGSQVVSQTPSAITVAYLRDGLSADGTPKHIATTA